MSEEIFDVNLKEKISKCYLDYSKAVITDRALPDFRDGLKPVARRILFAMHELGLRKNTPHKKCARIVGEVMGKFHPHGDSSIYGTLVRLAQDFSLLHPLIDGQGAFGSIDDGAAAMRYTEARLEKISELMLDDLSYNTVEYIDNFDSTQKEPMILPCRFPNLLVNGSSGIAVGMATNIPSHNLGEVIDALIYLIDNEDGTLHDVLKFIKGPDFPSGGIARYDTSKEQFYSGRGTIIVKAKIESLDVKRRQGLQIVELPYQVSKEKILEKIFSLIKMKKIEGVMDVRDETDRNGMCIVLEFSKKNDEDDIISKLYRFTALEEKFSFNFLALERNKPKLFDLLTYLKSYLEFRKEIAKNHFTYKLQQKQKQLNILEGYAKIIDDIENVIKIIRKSDSSDDIAQKLKVKYNLNTEQIKNILEIKLSRLSRIEEKNINEDIKKITKEITTIIDILESKKKMAEYLKDDFKEIKQKFAMKRKTKIVA